MNESPIPPSSILQNLYWNQVAKSSADEADRKAALATIAGIAAIEGSYAARVKAVNANGDLSAQGRASALQDASKQAQNTLDALTAPSLAKLDSQILAHTRALQKAATSPDANAVTEMRSVEARVAFAKIDPLLQPSAYLTLCQDGTDDLSCVAVENASGFAPLLKAEIIAQGRAIRAARTLPDQARALETATELRSILVASAAAVRRAVSTGPLIDPVQIAPLGSGQLEHLDE